MKDNELFQWTIIIEKTKCHVGYNPLRLISRHYKNIVNSSALVVMGKTGCVDRFINGVLLLRINDTRISVNNTRGNPERKHILQSLICLVQDHFGLI